MQNHIKMYHSNMTMFKSGCTTLHCDPYKIQDYANWCHEVFIVFRDIMIEYDRFHKNKLKIVFPIVIWPEIRMGKSETTIIGKMHPTLEKGLSLWWKTSFKKNCMFKLKLAFNLKHINNFPPYHILNGHLNLWYNLKEQNYDLSASFCFAVWLLFLITIMNTGDAT